MTGKSIEQIRNWLAGQTVEGLPHRELPRLETPDEAKRNDDDEDDLVGELTGRKKMKVTTHHTGVGDGTVGNKRRGRFEERDGGKDALLKFGRYEGRLLSDLAKTDQEYLRWLIKEDFPESLKAIVRLHVKGRR